jgi:ADP-ribose pyrophosphatase YjhB (NUDIX family)
MVTSISLAQRTAGWQMRAMSDSRRHPQRPILGVGALIIQDGCIVLVERGREPLKGEWSLPGGVVEVGERLEEAAKREVMEETGLLVEPSAVVEIFERIMRDSEQRPEYHYVLIDYLCEARGGELRAGDDVSRAEWVRRKDLAKYTLTAGTLPVIEKGFEQSRHGGCEPQRRTRNASD